MKSEERRDIRAGREKKPPGLDTAESACKEEGMERKIDVIGVEHQIMDLAIRISRIPATDGVSLVKDMCWAGGGNASSAVVALARLGASAAIVGSAGNDAYGDFCVKDMEKNQVDVSHLKQVEGETTLCICLAEEETQGRSFLGKMGTPAELTPEEVDEDFIGSARILHLSSLICETQSAAVAFARKHKVEISLDAGGYSEAGAKLAEESDILIMSKDFYRGMFGSDGHYLENCKKLLQKRPHIVIITLGKEGCVGAGHKEEFALESFSTEHEIADTTGAGDVFHGGFLYAWLYRYNKAPYHYSLEDCARFASAVSYLNCLTLGGRPGIPTLAMVDRFLADQTVEEGDLRERKRFYRNGIFDWRNEG